MITIENFIQKEATRVYGDMAEKVAFTLNIDPASVIGAMAGGYVANRVSRKEREEDAQRMPVTPGLEGDHYAQVANIMANLKIVFTPINVIYSVNNQVFEIIDAKEMTPEMREAFIRKDYGYFRNVLVNKMNMELQLAEQAFARLMLIQHAGMKNSPLPKQASYRRSLEQLLLLPSDEFGFSKFAAEKHVSNNTLPLLLNFDSLRPFGQSAWFFDPKEFNKVAGAFEAFGPDNGVVTMDDLRNQVNIGFLPDRVVFLHHGQMIEQLPALYMNEEGYQAFRDRDTPFFQRFFVEESQRIAAQIAKDVADQAATSIGKESEEKHEQEEKTAATLEEVVGDLGSLRTYSPLQRPVIHFFEDTDIHPMMYDKILNDRYGANWADYELEALFKQIEVDFDLPHGIDPMVVDKIGLMMAAKGDNSSVFVTPLTFEKFIRAMNNKDVNFSDFQANISFAEFLFGLDIARALRGAEVYDEMHVTVEQYVSEELFRSHIRFVSDQVYDEFVPSENAFFESLNSYLMRKWKEFDAHNLDGTAAEEQHARTEAIARIGRDILANHAERIEIDRVYDSVVGLIDDEHLLDAVPTEFQVSVRQATAENVTQHVMVALYAELRRQELVLLNEKWEEVK